MAHVPRGLYAITDSKLLSPEQLVEAVALAIQGGAQMIQYRNKSGDTELRQWEASDLNNMCRPLGVPLIINDDVALAGQVMAAGVHLGKDDADYGLRLFGIPSGYEFMSLMEAIEMVASGDSGLTPESKKQLGKITKPLELQVFVTPTCPYCPRAVVLAFRLAVQNANVRASMVEATEFPQLANRYQVGGVPHTVIGDGRQTMVGAYPEKAAVEMIVSGAGST